MTTENNDSPFFNTVVLVGRTGGDTEIRYFDSGSAKAEVSIAVDRGGRNKDGQKITDWFKVVFWGRQAEIASEYVKKGKQIAVEGVLQCDKWIDKSTGETRSSVYIRANTLQLLGSKSDA